jgi:hypothetical protein
MLQSLDKDNSIGWGTHMLVNIGGFQMPLAHYLYGISWLRCSRLR